MARNPVIVQISDLHLGRQTNPLILWRHTHSGQAMGALKEALQDIEPRPDFLVVTGDLTNGGRPAEMKQAREYLDGMLTCLWRRGQAARCIVIPGNHDVWRTTRGHIAGVLCRKDRLPNWRAQFEPAAFFAPGLDRTKRSHLEPKSLLQYYKGHGDIPEMAELKAGAALDVCEFFPEFQVAFLKLDSNIKDSRLPGHIARGKIGLEQRRRVSAVLYDYKEATKDDAVRFDDARLVCLTHHHLTRLPNTKLEDWMLMDDAGEVSKWLATLGVDLVLHGHHHRADAAGLTFWNLDQPATKTELVILSAGSATVRNPDDGHNSCHYIHLGHYHTAVWRPNLDNGEYQKLGVAAKFDFDRKPRLQTSEKDPLYIEALELSVRVEEKYADREHVYDSAESTGWIDKHLGYHGTVALTGRNMTGQPTEFIPFVLTAVGAQDASNFRCAALDLKTKRKLPAPRLQEVRPISVFPFRVYFANPLQPRQDFAVSVQFQLPNVMLKKYDYDMFNLLRFPRGIAKLTMHLFSELEMVGGSLWELRRSGLEKSKLLLKPGPTALVGKSATFGYEAEIDVPSALSYVIIYQELGDPV